MPKSRNSTFFDHMRIRFHSTTAAHAEGLLLPNDVTLLHGQALDDRGELALLCAGESSRRVEVSYDVDKMALTVGDRSDDADAAATLLAALNAETVVLEATTLGFAELFCVVNALLQLNVGKIEIIYAEPVGYNRLRPGGDQFALSDTTRGYQPIPQSIVDLTSDELESGVFFLGFEPERLDRALEEHQMISSKEIKVVFGIPAFHPGWELDSIIPHLPRLEQGSLAIEYCSANDPEAAFENLERTRSSLGIGKRMFVAPIGTKPCGIAAALFASVYPDQVGLLFDHPRRRANRTDGAYLWHRFSVRIIRDAELND